jgi:predicted ATP-dependent protease
VKTDVSLADFRSEGVIIPKSNVTNLMLKEEVVEAVREGRFHIWGMQTIDEGIEILTGVKAGERMETGIFEEGTVNDRVDKCLRELAEAIRKFTRAEEETTVEVGYGPIPHA